jgi:hypothetical protein
VDSRISIGTAAKFFRENPHGARQQYITGQTQKANNMQAINLKNNNLKIFAIISFTSGTLIVLSSLAGHFLTPAKLIPSAFIGGTIGLVSGTWLCFKQKMIDKASVIPVMIFTLIAFGIVSFVIVFNFNHPLLIFICFSLIGLTSIVSNYYFKKHPNTPKNKIFGTAGVLLVLPPLYFVIASILKFQFGNRFLFSFIDVLLNRPNGQENFNAITQFLFGGGLLLSFIVNVFSQIEISHSNKNIFGYKISGLSIQPFNLGILLITGIVGMIIILYLAFENFNPHCSYPGVNSLL